MHAEVLRLSHRLPRDERISTHVALVARAFGASAVIYTGQHDAGLEESVARICGKWGARTPSGPDFSITYQKSAAQLIRARKREGFTIVHLTMYGIPVQEALPAIRDAARLLIIVGSEHVPGEIFALSDHNVSVTGQPHSEVAALAIVLDRLMGGRELDPGGLDFGGKISVAPSARGKRITGEGGSHGAPASR